MFKKIFLFFFYGEFLGAPVVRTLCFHCQQLRSHNLHSVVKKKFFFFITQIERAKEKSVLKKKKKKPGRTTSLHKMAQTQFSLLLSTKCNYKPWK